MSRKVASHENTLLECFKTPIAQILPPEFIQEDSSKMKEVKARSSLMSFTYAKELYIANYKENKEYLTAKDDDDSVSSLSSLEMGDRYALPYTVAELKQFCEALPYCYPFTMVLNLPSNADRKKSKLCFCPCGTKLQGWRNKYNITYEVERNERGGK